LLRRRHLRWPRLEILQGEYGRIMALIFFFFLGLYLANPLYNPYWVDELHYGDQLLSLGTATFYACQFLSALQLKRISRILGDHRTLALGACLLSAYPGLTALSPHPIAMLLAAGISGAAWGIAGGALLSYLYAAIPEGERPRYLAWYSLLTNLAILGGSLLGPQIAALVGLRFGLGLAGLARFASGIFIWLWGQQSNKPVEPRQE
jgi:MFS family permease